MSEYNKFELNLCPSIQTKSHYYVRKQKIVMILYDKTNLNFLALKQEFCFDFIVLDANKTNLPDIN